MFFILRFMLIIAPVMAGGWGGAGHKGVLWHPGRARLWCLH